MDGILEKRQIQKEILKAQNISKMEANRAKKKETEIRQKREANLLYAAYRHDIANSTTTMDSLKAPVIQSAYKFFVKLFLQTPSYL